MRIFVGVLFFVFSFQFSVVHAYHEQETLLDYMRKGDRVEEAIIEGNKAGETYPDFVVTDSQTGVRKLVETKHIESSNPLAINRNVIEAQTQLKQTSMHPDITNKEIVININHTELTLEQAMTQLKRMHIPREFDVLVIKDGKTVIVEKNL